MMRTRGFSLIEMLIATSIAAILGLVGVLSLVSSRNTVNLKDATTQAGALLRTAQSHSMSQFQASSWGVHFANATNTPPFFALFKNSYSVVNTTGYYRLPSGVGYVTSTLNIGSTTDIMFSQVSGLASASTSIRFYLFNKTSQSSTISVASSGAIIY